MIYSRQRSAGRRLAMVVAVVLAVTLVTPSPSEAGSDTGSSATDVEDTAAVADAESSPLDRRITMSREGIFATCGTGGLGVGDTININDFGILSPGTTQFWIYSHRWLYTVPNNADPYWSNIGGHTFVSPQNVITVGGNIRIPRGHNALYMAFWMWIPHEARWHCLDAVWVPCQHGSYWGLNV